MNSQGYRGYITSHMQERSVPQHIQQMVIREYCKKNEFDFLLSATEYHEGTKMLISILQEDIAGVVMYSIFQMPTDKTKRYEIYYYGRLHFAAENMCVTNKQEQDKLEDIFLLRKILCRK